MPLQRWIGALAEAALACIFAASITGVADATITYTDVDADLPGTYYDSVAWADYDGDGDLDLLLSGGTGGIHDCYTGLFQYVTPFGVFTDAGVNLPWLMGSSVAWGDYDNDGDVDILLSGRDASETHLSLVYRNDGGAGFTDINAGLPGLMSGAVAWGDYDNDGDLDILLTGLSQTDSSPMMALCRNDGGGTFTPVDTALPHVSSSAVAWGDYDNDGDLDLLLTGHDAEMNRISRVYRNDGGGDFTDIDAGLIGVNSGSVAWGDYDNDGDLDILLGGHDSSIVPITRLYRNDGAGLFTSIDTGLPDVGICALAWGDHDNDGDLDILLAGRDAGSAQVSGVYSNEGGVFSDIGAGVIQVGEGSAAWADYDRDGDLDFVLTGRTGDSYLRTIVYRSYGAPANSQPTAPDGLSAIHLGDRVLLSWNAATDAQTPAAGLSYNLRIGTTPGGSEIMSSMARTLGGMRQVVQLGNAQMCTSWAVQIPPGAFYWTVQALDGAFAGSPFAAEQTGEVSGLDLVDAPGGLMLRIDFPGFVDPEVAVHFELPENAEVGLRVFDVAGRFVKTLIDSYLPEGSHQVLWDRTDSHGTRVSSGVYFFQMQAGSVRATERTVLIE